MERERHSQCLVFCLADSLKSLTNPFITLFFVWVFLISYKSYPQEFNIFIDTVKFSYPFIKQEKIAFPLTIPVFTGIKKIISIHQVSIVIVPQN